MKTRSVLNTVQRNSFFKMLALVAAFSQALTPIWAQAPGNPSPPPPQLTPRTPFVDGVLNYVDKTRDIGPLIIMNYSYEFYMNRVRNSDDLDLDIGKRSTFATSSGSFNPISTLNENNRNLREFFERKNEQVFGKTWESSRELLGSFDYTKPAAGGMRSMELANSVYRDLNDILDTNALKKVLGEDPLSESPLTKLRTPQRLASIEKLMRDDATFADILDSGVNIKGPNGEKLSQIKDQSWLDSTGKAPAEANSAPADAPNSPSEQVRKSRDQFTKADSEALTSALDRTVRSNQELQKLLTNGLPDVDKISAYGHQKQLQLEQAAPPGKELTQAEKEDIKANGDSALAVLQLASLAAKDNQDAQAAILVAVAAVKIGVILAVGASASVTTAGISLVVAALVVGLYHLYNNGNRAAVRNQRALFSQLRALREHMIRISEQLENIDIKTDRQFDRLDLKLGQFQEDMEFKFDQMERMLSGQFSEFTSRLDHNEQLTRRLADSIARNGAVEKQHWGDFLRQIETEACDGLECEYLRIPVNAHNQQAINEKAKELLPYNKYQDSMNRLLRNATTYSRGPIRSGVGLSGTAQGAPVPEILSEKLGNEDHPTGSSAVIGKASRDPFSDINTIRDALRQYGIDINPLRAPRKISKQDEFNAHYYNGAMNIYDYARNANQYVEYASRTATEHTPGYKLYSDHYCTYDPSLRKLRQLIEVGKLQRQSFRNVLPTDEKGHPSPLKLRRLFSEYENRLRKAEQTLDNNVIEHPLLNQGKLMGYDVRLEASNLTPDQRTRDPRFINLEDGIPPCDSYIPANEEWRLKRAPRLTAPSSGDFAGYSALVPKQFLIAKDLFGGEIRFCYEEVAIDETSNLEFWMKGYYTLSKLGHYTFLHQKLSDTGSFYKEGERFDKEQLVMAMAKRWNSVVRPFESQLLARGNGDKQQDKEIRLSISQIGAIIDEYLKNHLVAAQKKHQHQLALGVGPVEDVLAQAEAMKLLTKYSLFLFYGDSLDSDIQMMISTLPGRAALIGQHVRGKERTSLVLAPARLLSVLSDKSRTWKRPNLDLLDETITRLEVLHNHLSKFCPVTLQGTEVLEISPGPSLANDPYQLPFNKLLRSVTFPVKGEPSVTDLETANTYIEITLKELTRKSFIANSANTSVAVPSPTAEDVRSELQNVALVHRTIADLWGEAGSFDMLKNFVTQTLPDAAELEAWRKVQKIYAAPPFSQKQVARERIRKVLEHDVKLSSADRAVRVLASANLELKSQNTFLTQLAGYRAELKEQSRLITALQADFMADRRVFNRYYHLLNGRLTSLAKSVSKHHGYFHPTTDAFSKMERLLKETVSVAEDPALLDEFEEEAGNLVADSKKYLQPENIKTSKANLETVVGLKKRMTELSTFAANAKKNAVTLFDRIDPQSKEFEVSRSYRQNGKLKTQLSMRETPYIDNPEELESIWAARKVK